MTYKQLKKIMFLFRNGKNTRLEMELAIALWQRKEHPVRWPVIDGVIMNPDAVIMRTRL